ncbi:type IV pilus modification protein PilV [Candidatus Thiosymbion oneisti]|uniref:type IV pilus modification protein PilV n=1 Tax=Candidatus Thiosymbion oneisti TaxID=589554 RepID=UPI000AD4A131|nr:type IV pilus modification protein PilV [Candidatus Thiosymbion oneisti]
MIVGSPESIKGHRGFALIEALVTAFVLALGLMGLAALQMTGTKSTYSAEKGSQASMLADEMIERMRANRTVAHNGGYDIGLDSTPRTCDQAPCPSTPIENSDLCQWKQRLRCSLPSGDGAIGSSGNSVTVTIQWDDSLGLSERSSQQFVSATRL